MMVKIIVVVPFDATHSIPYTSRCHASLFIAVWGRSASSLAFWASLWDLLLKHPFLVNVLVLNFSSHHVCDLLGSSTFSNINNRALSSKRLHTSIFHPPPNAKTAQATLYLLLVEHVCIAISPLSTSPCNDRCILYDTFGNTPGTRPSMNAIIQTMHLLKLQESLEETNAFLTDHARETPNT